MFLQRLELQGFKSFAGKTTLDFPDGITAIVGPNGSGKSNITDAIRWILGEREAKSLRGAKSDDLIFAGTDKKPRSGFAQASLYFDNSTGIFPIEYKEVVITRRIDRDGESKFYINQSEMRLKDVVDFFASARLGARGLNIISQGESDAFLRANPLERRELIEEILGLKEYLLKKRRAVRELKNTDTNLEKARQSMEEMKPHLNMLRRAVKRYEERDNIASELKTLEESYFGSKVRTIVIELEKINPTLLQIEKDIETKKTDITSAEENLKHIEQSEPETKKELDNIRQKRRELIKEQMSLKPNVVLSRPVAQKIMRGTETILREIKFSAEKAINSSSVEEIREILKRIVSSVDEVFSVPEIKEEIQEPQKDLIYEAKIAEFQKLLDELDEVENKLSTGLDDFNKTFRNAINELEKRKDEFGKLNDKKEKLFFEREKLIYYRTELDNQLKAAGKSFDEYINIEVRKANTDLDPIQIERRIYRLRNELASIGETDESIVKEAKDTEERFTFLNTQTAELEKATIDLKSLIKELDQKVNKEFDGAIDKINSELNQFAKILFGGGSLSLRLQEPISTSPTEELLDGVMPANLIDEDMEEPKAGIEIDVVLPKKRIKGLEVLSGGERSLLSVAVLFGLVAISPPPFIVVDEVDAPLDEHNARLLGEILKHFESKTQFLIVTHNRSTMESANSLYGVTMGEDGSSRVISVKLTTGE